MNYKDEEPNRMKQSSEKDNVRLYYIHFNATHKVKILNNEWTGEH